MPAFGATSLDHIRRIAVKQWTIDLRSRYSLASVRGVVTLMSLVLTAAVEERMIAVNPIQGLRITDRRTGHPDIQTVKPARKRPVHTAEQVPAIAQRAEVLGGRAAYVMVITAAFTGMRWGRDHRSGPRQLPSR